MLRNNIWRIWIKGIRIWRESKTKFKNLIRKRKKIIFFNFKKYLIGNEYFDKAIISSDFPKNHNITLKRVIKEYLDLMKINIKENKKELKKK